MLSLIRSLLIILALAIVVGPIEANHSAKHQGKQKSTVSVRKAVQELARYNKEIVAAFDKYKAKSAMVWGEATVVPDTNIDVTYHGSLNQRSVVDYEEGSIDVELAMNTAQGSGSQLVKRKLAATVERALLQSADERSIIEMAENPIAPKNNRQPVLLGMVANEDGRPLTRAGMEKFKQAKIQKIKQRTITGEDGVDRTVYSTNLTLVPNHIRVRAEKYRGAVDENSQKHQIPTPIIYAIMETESYFNPTAKSPVPAFGLMQLVPATGARDAFRFLHAKDWVVKDTYLYNTTNNIELGVAYLHILYFRYLKYIKNPVSKQWATIAAYNTGVRNVFNSFVGKYSKSKHGSRWSWKQRALNKINKMEPEQVYKHMRQNLPYEETRNYLKKVRDRMGKYRS